MEAPDAVVAEDEFHLVVGLSKDPVDGCAEPADRAARRSSVGPYTLVVQVVADGFTLVDGGEWRRELPVTAAAPYPSVTYTLRADRATRLTCGRVRSRRCTRSTGRRSASRSGRSRSSHARSCSVRRARRGGAAANVIAIAPQKEAPDLTARITYSEAVSDGRLLWTFETTHGIDLPDRRRS